MLDNYYVGEICLFPFQKAPTGWLLCDGNEYNISMYSVLFALIGVTYGGNGTTKFRVPDLRGRLPIRLGEGPLLPNYPWGAKGGEEQVFLSGEQLPAHSHPLRASRSTSDQVLPSPSVYFGANSLGSQGLYAPAANVTSYKVMAPCVLPVGEGLPHDNMMPSLVGNYCICWNGIYPQRADI